MNAASGERIAEILEQAGEADEALRQVVSALADEPEVVWAGIAFLDAGELVLGPSAGTPDESRERVARIAYDGERVGELRVHGETEPAFLEQVAALVSPYVLIGWDTGGEAWDP